MADKAKVLIVEDEEILLAALKEELSSGGYDIEGAMDGVEGLEKVKTFKPELILLDLLMPKMDGLDVLKNLRKNKPTSATPVLVLTASATPTTMEKLKSLNVGGYIIKPFEPADLMGKINNLLKK